MFPVDGAGVPLCRTLNITRFYKSLYDVSQSPIHKHRAAYRALYVLCFMSCSHPYARMNTESRGGFCFLSSDTSVHCRCCSGSRPRCSDWRTTSPPPASIQCRGNTLWSTFLTFHSPVLWHLTTALLVQSCVHKLHRISPHLKVRLFLLTTEQVYMLIQAGSETKCLFEWKTFFIPTPGCTRQKNSIVLMIHNHYWRN